MKKLCFTIVLLILNFSGCTSTHGAYTFKGTVNPGTWLRNHSVSYTHEGKTHSESIQIYFPKRYVKGANMRTLVVLHGYDGTMRDWEINSRIEDYADEYSCVLVCPAMKKSIYETAYYPETGTKWSAMPGGRYVIEVLIPHLRTTFALAHDRDRTGIMGLSTGGRGALLLSARQPSFFAAAAGLSGDYDPLSMTRDRLLSAVYGKYDQNRQRWENDDNIMKLAVNLKGVPVFLTHGGKDFIVDPKQSEILAIKLKSLEKEDSSYSVTYKSYSRSLHDWSYWRKALPEVMAFFDARLEKNN